MKEAKEIYKLIEQSGLSKEEKDKLHAWYREAHIKVTEKAKVELRRVKQQREYRIERLQNKILRRIR